MTNARETPGDDRDRVQAIRDEPRAGLKQIERGEVIDFTPALLDQLAREAEQHARDGKPVRNVVKP